MKMHNLHKAQHTSPFKNIIFWLNVDKRKRDDTKAYFFIYLTAMFGWYYFDNAIVAELN